MGKDDKVYVTVDHVLDKLDAAIPTREQIDEVDMTEEEWGKVEKGLEDLHAQLGTLQRKARDACTTAYLKRWDKQLDREMGREG